MAIKPFNSVGGYSIGPNLEVVIDQNGSATFLDVTVSGGLTLTAGDTQLGNVETVHIDGGTAGQFLQTNGSGNLTWATVDTDTLANGTTSVTIDNANGPVTVNVGGTMTTEFSSFGIATAGDIIVDEGLGMGNVVISAVTTNMVLTNNSETVEVSPAGLFVSGIGNASVAAGTISITDANGDAAIATLPEQVVTKALLDLAMSNVPGANVFGNVSSAELSYALDSDTANVTITGGTTGQYLRSLDGATGTVEWATIDTDTLANGTSNVSIEATNGPVTIGVAGNANVAVFSGTGLTVQSNIAATNITTTGGVSTANLTANALVTLGAVGNVKITGGANGLALTTDGTGNLSWTNQSIKYTREWHVDPALGNDTTGTGSYNFPFATIMRAHTAASSGASIYLHIGTYTENVTLTKTNIDIIGLSAGGTVNCSGTWTVGTTTGASIRLIDVAISGAFTQNGTGRLFIRRSNLKSTFVRTSGEYTEFNDVDAAGTGFAVNSGGQFAINGGQQNAVSVNSATALVSINNSLGIGTLSVTAGTVIVNGGYVFSATATTPAVTSSVGSAVYLFGALLTTPTNVPARVSLAGFWTTTGTSYDRANSTLTGTNLGTISYNDAINTVGLANVGSLQVRGTSTLGPVGNVAITGGSAGQYLQTNGSGVLSWSTAALSNIANGTSNIAIAGTNGNAVISVNGQGNIVTVASNGVFATTTINDDVIVTGNLTVQGNTISVNVTELNVEDPIITEGRGPDNTPLTSADGKDRGLFSYYYDGAEKAGFIGLMTTGTYAGDYVVSTDATVSNNVVTVNSYGNIAVGNVIGNLANGTSSVGIAGVDGDITLSVDGTSNVVVASATGIDVAGVVKVRTVTAIDASTATTTSTTPTVVAEVDYADGLAVEFLVKGRDTIAAVSEVNTVMAVCEGGGADHTIYGSVNSGAAVGSFTVAVNAGKLQLIATAASANNTAWVVQFRTI